MENNTAQGKCPFTGGALKQSAGGGTRNRDWWPNQLKLNILRQNSSLSNRWAEDKPKQERFQQWLKSLQKDIYLDQALKVMNDMIGQQNLVKSKTTEEPVKKAF